MTRSEYDPYSDERRPVELSEPRERFIRVLTVLGWVLGVVGLLLVVATYVDSALVRHQYYFFLTEQYGLAIGGAFLLVLAVNAWFWSRWLKGLGDRAATVAAIIALVVLSPVAVFAITLGIALTASPQGP